MSIAKAEAAILTGAGAGIGHAIAHHLVKDVLAIFIADRVAECARNSAHYKASKASVVGFTKAITLELAGKRFAVDAISAGVFMTDKLLERPEVVLPQPAPPHTPARCANPNTLLMPPNF